MIAADALSTEIDVILNFFLNEKEKSTANFHESAEEIDFPIKETDGEDKVILYTPENG